MEKEERRVESQTTIFQDAPEMPRALEPTKRSAIVALHKAGLTHAQIAVQEKVSFTAIKNTLDKYNRTGSYETLKRSGRPTKARSVPSFSSSCSPCDAAPRSSPNVEGIAGDWGPILNDQGTEKGGFCAFHTELGLVDLRSKLCEEYDRNQQPSFPVNGSHQEEPILGCPQGSEMVDLICEDHDSEKRTDGVSRASLPIS
ncbi:hypothetical protein DFS34DRAFT_589305 [Phlyctochytrium arcticum]|nr:hypothetical protein DFS34DRAFT_589305 [Phlyctochytrium arcticum]